MNKASYLGSSVSDMPRGRPKPKLAITVDADVYDGVLAAAAEEGTSISAWVTEAARKALVCRNGLAAMTEWEAEHGAFTNEELAEAHADLVAWGELAE